MPMQVCSSNGNTNRNGVKHVNQGKIFHYISWPTVWMYNLKQTKKPQINQTTNPPHTHTTKENCKDIWKVGPKSIKAYAN